MPPEGQLLTIHPKLSFPIGKVFSSGDSFNGPVRGEWWYRHQHLGMQGPFKSKLEAERDLLSSEAVGPWMDTYRMWWWTDANGGNHGPYLTLGEADASVLEFENNP
jgi:hypothetical protein